MALPGRPRRGAPRGEGLGLGAMVHLARRRSHAGTPLGLWYPEDIGFVFLNVSLAAINGVVHYRLLTNRPVTWRWMLALSAMDIALITANIAVSGRFDNLIFVTYYPALAIFAVVFSSLWLILAWVTAAAVAYSLTVFAAGPGLDIEVGQDHVLVARLSVMYLVAVGISLVVRFERTRRLGRDGEGAAGAPGAHRTLPGASRHHRADRLHDRPGHRGRHEAGGRFEPEAGGATRGDGRAVQVGHVGAQEADRHGPHLRGLDLARLLGAHTATFAKITSVPAEMVQNGREPPLSTEVRTGLFSIAHNALANAFLHAQAGRVEVRLDFEAGGTRLSVSDDGSGLPEDYAERAAASKAWRRTSERMGGRLIVESGGPEGGTAITCFVPHESAGRGD